LQGHLAKVKMNPKIQFLVTLTFFCLGSAHADTLENGCVFNEGPVINRQATYQVTSKDNAGVSHSLLWLKNADPGGLVVNAGAVDKNGIIIPPGWNPTQDTNQNATTVCDHQQLSLPTLEEFESLRNCFAPILDPLDQNNLLSVLFSDQELANYQSKFPNDFSGGYHANFWSSTDATGIDVLNGDNPSAYIFGSDGDYDIDVRIGEVEQRNSVRCVKRSN
jgi:hypothetical protein